MKKNVKLAISLLLFLNAMYAQHTFSIVAVDSITKEVGGAGATCLSIDREGYEALIISDLIPGIGALHTQSYWHPSNQINARVQMENGKNAKQIIDWLTINDVEGNPKVRQYGIAHLATDGSANAAGYTGINCLNEKKHSVGKNYSIQGNILIGNHVIDSMEARFLRAQGSLADRLMQAMQGANIIGADSRCFSEGISSRSSFLRVAKPTDPDGNPYINIIVSSVEPGTDPIDSLQNLYNDYKKNTTNNNPITKTKIDCNYNTNSNSIELKNNAISYINNITIFNFDSKTIFRTTIIKENIPIGKIPTGAYLISLQLHNGETISKKLIIP